VEQHRYRTTIAVLWILQVANYAAYNFITLSEGGTLRLKGILPLIMAVDFFIPCLLAWATMVFGRTVCRWPNIIFGGVVCADQAQLSDRIRADRHKAVTCYACQ
jgi:hypothetical protein